MPLDTAAVTTGLDVSPGPDRYDRGLDPARMLESAPSIGSALRGIRDYYRLSIEDVSLATCIRKQYLWGIEEMRLDGLPSRPFLIGYVRAYAGALGLDPDRAVARFKMEFPEDRTALRAPVGVAKEGDRRLRPILIGLVLVVLAFIAWNIAQRAMSRTEPTRNAEAEVAVSSARAAAPTKGPITVGAPLPAPQESTLPAPYVTPGLAPASADGSPTSALKPATTPAPAAPAAPMGTPFAARGTIYGASASPSAIILQANKSASMIVRGADGTVYFARQLAAGEAYRAPQIAGLSVEVSDPAVVNVFIGGQLRGPLPGSRAVIAKLVEPAAPLN